MTQLTPAEAAKEAAVITDIAWLNTFTGNARRAAGHAISAQYAEVSPRTYMLAAMDHWLAKGCTPTECAAIRARVA